MLEIRDLKDSRFKIQDSRFSAPKGFWGEDEDIRDATSQE